MTEIRAVITGDLIHSRQHSPEVLERAMTVIARQAGRLTETETDTRFTRYRGDGWQIYLGVPGLCLSAVLQIAAALRADGLPIATRQSIGLGTISSLPAESLAAAQGDAFEVSGLGLDHMDKSRRMTIAGRGIVTPWHEAILALADWHASRWTQPQAEAIELSLRSTGETQADLAAALGITRQAWQARLSGAGFAAWEPALWAFQSENWRDADA